MPRAILSVHDKAGLTDFARSLHDLGWTLIASGGTARTLRDNAIPVTEVADFGNGDAVVAQCFGRAAGCDERPAQIVQAASEIGESGFVMDG